MHRIYIHGFRNLPIVLNHVGFRKKGASHFVNFCLIHILLSSVETGEGEFGRFNEPGPTSSGGPEQGTGRLKK